MQHDNNTELKSSELEESISTDIEKENSNSFQIIHGSVIQDRRSIFQAHVCSIESHNEVR